MKNENEIRYVNLSEINFVLLFDIILIQKHSTPI